MENENLFNNQQKEGVEMKPKRTKEEAQHELVEKFGLTKTSDFQLALQKGKIELAEQWLNYIVENKENFPQYEATWNSWLKDRQKDLEVYKKLKSDGLLENMEYRTKDEARTELVEKFGFADTKGFREMLQNDVARAEEWLNYIVANKMRFPQYLATWDSWLRDRQAELMTAKK